jgi:hypothetical protein
VVLSFWYLGRDLKPLFWLTGSDEDLGFSLARRVCMLKIFVQASGLLLLLLHQTYQEVSDLVLKERLRIEEHRRRGRRRRKRKENRWRE